jgi:hypothetical protein
MGPRLESLSRREFRAGDGNFPSNRTPAGFCPEKSGADFSEEIDHVGEADLRRISREPCWSSVSEKRQ